MRDPDTSESLFLATDEEVHSTNEDERGSTAASREVRLEERIECAGEIAPSWTASLRGSAVGVYQQFLP